MREKKNPIDRSNVLSQLCFCWLLPYFFKGYKRVLTEDDMYKNRSVHDSEMLGNKLERVWNEKMSLGKSLVSIFIGEFLSICFLSAVSETCKMIQPFLIYRLLNFYDQNRSSENTSNIYTYALLLVLFLILGALCLHTFALRIVELGMRIRVACTSLIYRKALKLNQSAFTETSAGQIVNLLSNDVRKLEYTHYVNQIFFAPIEAVVVMVLIYVSVGWYGLLGAVCFLFSILMSSFLGKLAGRFRFNTAQKADKRFVLVNQILSGIEVVKMFAWESFVGQQVEEARKQEIKQLTRSSIVRGLSIFTPVTFTKLAMFSAVVLYVLTGNTLNSSYVFTLTAFYRLLETATMHFPTGAASFAEMLASIKRIQQYLMQEDYVKNESLQDFTETKDDNTIAVELRNVGAKWPNSTTDTIRNLTMKVPSGRLTTMIGHSGSGKTTLLNVILQELLPSQGSVKVSGSVSYASQEPWLFGDTIRENILFGQSYEEKRYKEVVKACALERDFELLQYGDGTITGDRGLSLSGGQKARINLARAIYRDADIYLLDDPLSAVDNRVGRHIFETAILGFLKNKTVVLVTHQIQYLKNIENIILLKEGSIEYYTSYDQLKENSEEYFHDLKDVLDEDNEDIEANMETEEQSKSVVNKSQQIMKEEKNTGAIPTRVYTEYFFASGHWCGIFLMLLFFVITQVLDSASDYFVSYWINIQQEDHLVKRDNNHTASEDLFLETNRSSIKIHTNKYIDIIFHGQYTLIFYTNIVLMFIIFALARSLYFYFWSVRISKRMHSNMLNKILMSPLKFFSQNPSGRILNRFSKDISALDEEIPTFLMDSIRVGMNMISIYIIIGILNFWTLIPSLIIFCIYIYMRKYYLETSRDIKRIESINRGPMFTHLTQSLQGITTIRSFNVQEKFKNEFDMYQNVHSSAFFMILASSRTYGFWIDMFSHIYVCCVLFFLLIVKKENLGGNIGFALSQALWLTQALQKGMRQWGEFENQMIAVERIQEYIDLQPEVDIQGEPPKLWPLSGTIEYKNVYLRYSKGSQPALDGISISIESNEKIGIVGRTGAGKSSLLRVLLRLVDFDGIILIDGVSSKILSLQALRTKISVISQVPLLFSGTLRDNLDPFKKHNDELLWKALEDVEMKLKIEKLPESLNTSIAEGGNNFSIGERQLLCLARAIVNHNKILFLDEATSNVDPQTDKLIQKAIREKFSECTVLTIAHRLQTVMDSDRVLVIDNGKVVEFDQPANLLEKKDGYFYSLVSQQSLKDQ